MSRAFVSEDAIGKAGTEIPERPVSDRPNLVTRRGRRLIEHRIADLQAALDGIAPDDEDRRQILLRDLRYWRAREESARIVEVPDGPLEEVCFGAIVTLRTRNNALRRYRLVGEDEADPEEGLLNWAAPLATGLIGAGVGELVEFEGALPPVEIMAIERPDEADS